MVKKSELAMKEGQLLDALIGERGLARMFSWTVAHFRPGKTSRQYVNKQGEIKDVWVTPVQGDGAGFPDLVLVHGQYMQLAAYGEGKVTIPGRTIWAELKSDSGKLSPEQILWLDLLIDTEGAEVYLWRPSDLEEIQLILGMGHAPNKIEKLELKTAWNNRREE